MGSRAAPPLAGHHPSPAMASSASASAAAAAKADNPFCPIDISSDEDDEVTVLGSSSSREEMQIQQAILLSLDPSRDQATAPSSSGTAVAGTPEGSIPDRKGRRKLRSELPLFPVDPSRSPSKPETRQVIDLDDDSPPQVIDLDDDDGCSLIFLKDIASGKRKLFEKGECSNSAKKFDCTICMETVPGVERFRIPGCRHAFCAGCVRQYIAARVEENLLAIGCPDPGCKNGVLHPEECRRVIPAPLFHRWGAALCDMALGELKFYCPFKDCSALLVDDDPGDGDGDAAAKVECPHCKRVFCAKCKVPWHEGVECAEFQRLGDDERGREDLLLRKVAQQSKWQRCPKCKIYVERVDGCTFIACRCGHCFCYLCGSTMARSNHYCAKCKR
ncbi:probable E3 ubiquitin-protein ligase RNF144A-B [Triticum dicoccoides]|uniref:probable E3 ubiquitin-protein ligase RNF144A-B n=1 Tax=Triticum dicoccoides TaxID=85692 RepID=UPI001890697D|nr:probable E3 ubiquitin-protein ligase RNF144A-B [Triticum dicoccoides]